MRRPDPGRDLQAEGRRAPPGPRWFLDRPAAGDLDAVAALEERAGSGGHEIRARLVGPAAVGAGVDGVRAGAGVDHGDGCGHVEWAYDVWERLVAGLRDPDNHVRSICAQVLCSLARNDPEQRIVRDFPALLEPTRDARFVTARHCLQSLWKVGAVGGTAAEAYRAGPAHRFAGCRAEKNWSLIRYDIVCSLRAAFDVTGDETLRVTAQELIATEDDARYRKKYAAVW